MMELEFTPLVKASVATSLTLISIRNCTISNIVLGRQKQTFVNKFKYLGHIVNTELNDNDDFQSEIKNIPSLEYVDITI